MLNRFSLFLLLFSLAACGDDSAVFDAGTTGDGGGGDVGVRDTGLTCPGCFVDGACYGEGQRNPANGCEVCDATSSASAWSPNEGASCDDGLYCTTGDVCTGSTCGGGARDCSDGVACTGEETCDETADVCARGTSSCGEGELCDVAADACVVTCTGCVIDGACYGEGQRNPANGCEVCNATSSASAWSPNEGASCDDGLYCTTGDVCTGSTCGGGARDCSDGVACTGDETCDEDADACTRGTSTCGADELCDMAADACVATCGGCVIGGVCYGEGQLDPGNACRVCDTARSGSDWSDNDGARCDDGLFCSTGDTCGGGVCAGSGTTVCEAGAVCDPGVDRCTGSRRYGAAGVSQFFVVPAGVTSLTVEAAGGQGGCFGGRGGVATAEISVVPGETIRVEVGGEGGCEVYGEPGFTDGRGGYNGGGDAHGARRDGIEGGGGGGTDVRRGSDRLLVAGGGGGGFRGGDGGGLNGGDGDGGLPGSGCGGFGGTQTAGGAGGIYLGDTADSGDSPVEGWGGDGVSRPDYGGGGGGGYHGGGGGAGGCGGGGGSSRADFPGNTSPSTTAGVNEGHGYVTISY